MSPKPVSIFKNAALPSGTPGAYEWLKPDSHVSAQTERKRLTLDLCSEQHESEGFRGVAVRELIITVSPEPSNQLHMWNWAVVVVFSSPGLQISNALSRSQSSCVPVGRP